MRLSITMNAKETKAIENLINSTKTIATMVVGGDNPVVNTCKAATEKFKAFCGIKRKDFEGNCAYNLDTTEGIKFDFHMSTKSTCAIIKVCELAVMPIMTAIRDFTNASEAMTEVLDEAEVKSMTFIDDENETKSIFIGEGLEFEMLTHIDLDEYETIYLGEHDGYTPEVANAFFRRKNVAWGYDLDKVMEERYSKPEEKEETAEQSAEDFLAFKDKEEKVHPEFDLSEHNKTFKCIGLFESDAVITFTRVNSKSGQEEKGIYLQPEITKAELDEAGINLFDFAAVYLRNNASYEDAIMEAVENLTFITEVHRAPNFVAARNMFIFGQTIPTMKMSDLE